MNGQPVGMQYNNRLYFIHSDHLGTPRAITDQWNTLVWRWRSKPFGDSPPEQDPDGDGQSIAFNLRFPGQYFDEETGFYYNYFRYYDPSTGRYITSDPIGLEGGLNTYGYAFDNPVSFFDSTGEAGRGNRGDGSASGSGTNQPYKHCKQHPTKPNMLQCKRKRDGKKVDIPKPPGWDDANNQNFLSCGESCQKVIVRTRDIVTGIIIFTWICITAPLAN